MSLINFIKKLFFKEDKEPVNLDERPVNGALVYKDKDIVALDDVWITKSVTGNIYGGKDITVCKDVEITGDVNCRKCVLEGKIKGNISVSDTLEIRAGAVLKGNIIAKKLDVNPEAVLNGNVTIVKDGRLIYADIKLNIARINRLKPEKEEPIFETHEPVQVQDDLQEINLKREAPVQVQKGPEHAEVPKINIQPEKPKTDPNENNGKWW
jgi:cytoskeletal protein CcmA (bactofilin family)